MEICQTTTEIAISTVMTNKYLRMSSRSQYGKEYFFFVIKLCNYTIVNGSAPDRESKNKYIMKNK